MPFASLTICLSTWFLTSRAAAFEYSKYFNQKVRSFIKNFGPLSVFVTMSVWNQRPFFKNIGVPTLVVSDTFHLAGNRPFLVSLSALPFCFGSFRIPRMQTHGWKLFPAPNSGRLCREAKIKRQSVV
ncbi:hypothetical protein ACA910_002403 [Epithemia clementina (nom. ined.)]